MGDVMVNSLNLIHFSASHLGTLRNIEQDSTFKPKGLWVSSEGNGDGWSDWCKSEKFHLENLVCPHRIVLRNEHDILHIRNVIDIDKFHDEFSIPITASVDLRHISWREVAKQWKGIIIAPYLWARRLGSPTGVSDWYYPWDCASGCIWDVSAIERVEP